MELISYKKFFVMALSGEITLSNDKGADVFCSWKAGGQEFYAFGMIGGLDV